MLAGQTIDLLRFFDVIIANRAKLSLMFLCRAYPRQLFVLIFADALGNLADLLLQLQKLLICHIIRVDIHSSLIMHPYHHVLQVFHVHNAIFLTSMLSKACTFPATLRIFGSGCVRCTALVIISSLTVSIATTLIFSFSLYTCLIPLLSHAISKIAITLPLSSSPSLFCSVPSFPCTSYAVPYKQERS